MKTVIDFIHGEWYSMYGVKQDFWVAPNSLRAGRFNRNSGSPVLSFADPPAAVVIKQRVIWAGAYYQYTSPRWKK